MVAFINSNIHKVSQLIDNIHTINQQEVIKRVTERIELSVNCYDYFLAVTKACLAYSIGSVLVISSSLSKSCK